MQLPQKIDLSEGTNSTVINNALDCINRPFDFHENPKFHDGYVGNTCALVDYYDDNGVSTPTNASGGDYLISGVGIMYSYGTNWVSSSPIDLITGAASLLVDGPIYFFIDSDGNIISWVAPVSDTGKRVGSRMGKDEFVEVEEKFETTTQNSFFTLPTSNYAQLYGGYPMPVYGDGIIAIIRKLSAGIRMWPLIEVITNSDTLAVSRYYGAQVAPHDLWDWAANDTPVNVYSALADIADSAQFTNKDGISARLNPVQESWLSPHLMFDVGNLLDLTNDTSVNVYPVIVARFTTNVSLSNGLFTTLPVRSMFRTLSECVLAQPTPIYASRPSYVDRFYEYIRWFQYHVAEYPTIVKGCSFNQVRLQLDKLNSLNTTSYDTVANITGELTSQRKVINRLYTLFESMANQTARPAKLKSKKQAKQGKKKYKPVLKNNANTFNNKMKDNNPAKDIKISSD